MSPKPNVQKPLDLDGVSITVAHNGYLIETDAEGSEALQVFTTWESLTQWLFFNLAKPAAIPVN